MAEREERGSGLIPAATADPFAPSREALAAAEASVAAGVVESAAKAGAMPSRATSRKSGANVDLTASS